MFLCGDLYLRVDEWGNDGLQRKLAGHGLRVIFEPYGEFFELLQLRQIQDGVALKKRPEKEATLATMRYVVGRLVRAVRAEHPWVFWNEVRDVDRESRRLVAPYPFGETIPTVGGALLSWRTQPIDGVVSVAPRGCGPALIAEAQLRREAISRCSSSTTTATPSTKPGSPASPGGSAAGPRGAPPAEPLNRPTSRSLSLKQRLRLLPLCAHGFRSTRAGRLTPRPPLPRRAA